MSRGHTLCWELDHRDPQDDFHDIDGGHYLEALSSLPQYLRLLMEDSDVRADIQEINGRYVVTRIVKKRDPEFSQGEDQYFTVDTDGRRIPISEEEYNKQLGLQTNPEDVFLACEVQTLDHEYTTPRDQWDLVFDASRFIQIITQAQNAGETLTFTEVNQLADEHIYSSDYFLYPAHKDGWTHLGRKIATLLEKQVCSKGLLYRMIRDNNIHPSDAKKLWTIWQDQQVKIHGKVKLASWDFQRKLAHKLFRQGLDAKEILARVKTAVAKIYGSQQVDSIQLPTQNSTQWLPTVVPARPSQDDSEFVLSDWLENLFQIEAIVETDKKEEEV